jgi:hypothetical protein
MTIRAATRNARIDALASLRLWVSAAPGDYAVVSVSARGVEGIVRVAS